MSDEPPVDSSLEPARKLAKASKAEKAERRAHRRAKSRAFAIRLYRTIVDRDLHNHAAEMAYFSMMAVFPFFLLLTTFLSKLPIPDLFGEIMRLLEGYAPERVVRLLEDTVREVTSMRELPTPKLVLTVLVCLWWSIGAMGSTTRGLNKAFGLADPRHYGRFVLLNFGVTLLFSQLLVVAMVLIMLGPVIHEELISRIDLGAVEDWPLILFRWTIVLATLFLTHAGLYWICPAIKRRFRLFTPGTICVVIGWILVSSGLRFYLKYVTSYDVVFGSLGTVIILMFWFFLMSLLLLVGGAIDAITHPEYVRRVDDKGKPIAEPFSWRLVLATTVTVIGIPLAIWVALEPESFTPNPHEIRGELREAILKSQAEGASRFGSEPLRAIFAAVIDPVTGEVDYRELRTRRETLEAWVQSFEQVEIRNLAWDDLQANLINLYIVGVWRLVLDGQAGNRAITERADARSVTIAALDQGRYEVCLRDVKDRILRIFSDDPRILIALHGGARTHPPLLSEPYEGERLAEQLTTLTQRALRSPHTVVEGERLRLPHLFARYEGAFAHGTFGSLAAWLLTQDLEPEARGLLTRLGAKALSYAPEDSTLNERPSPPSPR